MEDNKHHKSIWTRVQFHAGEERYITRLLGTYRLIFEFLFSWGISDTEKLHIESGKESAFLRVSRNGVQLLSVASLGLTAGHCQHKPVDLFEASNSEASEETKSKEIRSFVVNQPFSVFLIDLESDCVLYQARVKVPEPLSPSSELPSNCG